jgi:hypothetical protein
MDGLRALDVATKHKVVADRIVGDLCGDDLVELALDLMSMYWQAAGKLLSSQGIVATLSALHEVREHSPDWDERHAATLILAHTMWVDVPGVDAELRRFGSAALLEKFNSVEVFNNMAGVVSAIPRVWRQQLPQLAAPGGQDLLAHMVTQELSND